MNTSLRFATLIAFAAMLSGCLVVSQFDYAISVNAARTKATAVSIYRGIEGTAGDSVQTQIDFQELIEDWKGDAYVKDREATGVKIVDRAVYLEEGALCGRQVSEFTKDTPGFASFFSRDTVRIAFQNSDFDSIVTTNGAVTRRLDSTVVAWAPGAPQYHVVLQIKRPADRVDLTSMFRAYLASHK